MPTSPQRPTVGGLTIAARCLLLLLLVLFTGGAATQFFLAGLSLFDNPSRWADHASLGHILGLIPWILWVPAVVGRAGWRLITGSLVLLVLFMAQYAFIESGDPYAQALHPLNGAVMFALALWMTRRALSLLRRAPRTRTVEEGMVSGSIERMAGL